MVSILWALFLGAVGIEFKNDLERQKKTDTQFVLVLRPELRFYCYVIIFCLSIYSMPP